MAMNEIQLIKDELCILSIHPEKGWIRRRQNIGYAVLAASLCDLVLLDKLKVIQGKIEASLAGTDDPLLNELSERLYKHNGSKLWWWMSGRSSRATALFSKQMKLLETKRMITSRAVEWLGIRVGWRFHVNHKYNTTAEITRLERALIYGREPDLRLRVLIELMVVLDMAGDFFSQGELRKIARKRGKEICKHKFPENHETFRALFKELRSLLKVAGSHGV